MSKRLAIICPGQGGQHGQMFALAQAEPRLRQLQGSWLAAAKLDAPLDEVLCDKELLFSNRAAQPLVVLAALLAWDGVKEAIPAPSLVCGYSIGELAAYAVADALRSEDTIALAARRAELMDQSARNSARQVMMAVSGLDRATLQRLLPEHALFIAIETGEYSFIVGGLAQAAAEFAAEATQLGAQTSELPVAVASHTPLMHDAAVAFERELERLSLQDPRCAVLSGITGEPVRAAAAAKSVLCRQIEQEIRWAACMDRCAESGITIALELGPGAALSRMLRSRHASIDCRSVADFRTFAGVVKWIKRHFE